MSLYRCLAYYGSEQYEFKLFSISREDLVDSLEAFGYTVIVVIKL